MVFTTRLSGGKGGRFHQTLKRWLTGQPRAATVANLQTQLDTFIDEYNHHRPHRSLPHKAIPATAHNSRPKVRPGKRTDTHDRVRRDRVDDYGTLTLRLAGRLHHISIGRTHARTRIQPRGVPCGRPRKKP